jgi:hypothetical protein
VQLAGYYGLDLVTAGGSTVFNQQGNFGIGTTTSAIIDEVVYSLPKLGTSSDPSTTAYTNSGTSLSRTTSYTPSTTSIIKPYIKCFLDYLKTIEE